MFFNQRRLIVEHAAANRLPGMYPEREYAEAGGLLGYGPSVPDNFRRAAGYVARILRGEKAGHLPIEQPAKFDHLPTDQFALNFTKIKFEYSRRRTTARSRRSRPHGI